jgi:hypothetical protein
MSARMGLRPSLRAYLADGEWHSFGEIYAAVGTMINPSTATRRALATVQADARYDGRAVPEDLDPRIPPDVHIRRGRRKQLWHALNKLGCEKVGVGVGASWRKPPSTSIRSAP